MSLFAFSVSCCDWETFFNSKQVSVEESASGAQIIFKGFTTAEAPALADDFSNVYTARFELINSYKGADALETWNANNYRYYRDNIVVGDDFVVHGIL